jgi:serine/threonine-protein kinase RsbW
MNLHLSDMERQELKFSTQKENIHMVEKLIDKVSEEYKIEETNYGNMLIAVTEAVYNAMFHGNKSNPQKSVFVAFEKNNTGITYTIKDEGDGFDPDSLPDPTAPENLEKEFGRGVFLMRNLSDHIAFEDNGRSVKLSFNLKKD